MVKRVRSATDQRGTQPVQEGFVLLGKSRGEHGTAGVVPDLNRVHVALYQESYEQGVGANMVFSTLTSLIFASIRE